MSNFKPTQFHYQVLNMMPKDAIQNAKKCVSLLGYTGTINFLMSQSNGKVGEKIATTIADIALHNLDETPVIFVNLN